MASDLVTPNLTTQLRQMVVDLVVTGRSGEPMMDLWTRAMALAAEAEAAAPDRVLAPFTPPTSFPATAVTGGGFAVTLLMRWKDTYIGILHDARIGDDALTWHLDGSAVYDRDDDDHRLTGAAEAFPAGTGLPEYSPPLRPAPLTIVHAPPRELQLVDEVAD